MSDEQEIISQLFRTEFSKMVAVLAKYFGLENIELAEDIISDTFLSATETWSSKGIPDNPGNWLYAVAKYKVAHHIKRNKIYREKILPVITPNKTFENVFDADFSTENIKDSQLQMLFAVCSPHIASEAQIGLALRILCGFGIDEIAEAFFTNKETINKRLFRAKERLRFLDFKIEMPGDKQLTERLDIVLHIIYLLFNEGYYSSTKNQALRQELCLEAMRLGLLLTEFGKTNLPKTNALMALMCYHSSRFGARMSADSTPVIFDEQDKGLWDRELINRGNQFLMLSAKGHELSSYHIEAKIAFCHAEVTDHEEKWKEILDLYDKLLCLNYSPGVAVNRVFAILKLKGPHEALTELNGLSLPENIFYYTLLGEIYTSIDSEMSGVYFRKALRVAKSQGDKTILSGKIASLKL